MIQKNSRKKHKTKQTDDSGIYNLLYICVSQTDDTRALT